MISLSLIMFALGRPAMGSEWSKALPPSIQTMLHDAASLSESEITPEVVTAVHGMLTRLNSMKETIKGAHKGTGRSVAQSLSVIGRGLKAEKDSSEAAIAADNALIQCYNAEYEMAKEMNTAESKLTSLTKNRDVVCVYNTRTNATAPASQIACSFKNPETCAQKEAELKESMKVTMEKITTEIKGDVTEYTEDKRVCDAAKAAVVLATQDRDVKVRTWRAKQVVCASAKNKADAAMCGFKAQTTAKCARVKAYNELVKQIQTKGQAHSDLDRRTEWHAVSMASCILGGIISKKPTDKCEGMINFDSQVGKLNLGQEIVKKMNSAPNWSCESSTTWKFSGLKWHFREPVNSLKDYLARHRNVRKIADLQCS